MKRQGRLRDRLAISCFAMMSALPLSDINVMAMESYKGASLKLVVGMPPGGGVDDYARLLQRHMVQHLSGASGIVVQNMPGAGSLRSVQSLKAAPDDGSTIVTFSSAILTDAILNPNQMKVDFRDYKFIGNLSEDTRVCWVRNGFGAGSIADLSKEKKVIFGATTASQPEALMLQNLLGLNMKIVMGYAGSAEKRLALEKGEVDADCGGWTSIPASWKVAGSPVNVFVRLSPTLLPGMQESIPYGGVLVKDAELNRIFEFLTAPKRLGRPFMVKGNIASDKLAELRRAFDLTAADPAFLADAERMDLTIMPISGPDVDREIAEIYETPGPLLEKARRLTAN